MNRSFLVPVLLVCGLGWAVVVVEPSHAQDVAPICTENTRACMIATAQTYFDGLAAHDASKIPFAPDSRRTEQGRITGDGEGSMRSVVDHEPDMTVSRARWFVDESQNMVIGFTRLHVAERNADPEREAYKTSGGPSTVHLAERFKVVDGLIREVEAIFYIARNTLNGTSVWDD